MAPRAMGRVVRALLTLLALLPVLVAPLAAAGGSVARPAAVGPFAEGVVVELGPGNWTWNVSEGEYWFQYAAGPDGAVLDPRPALAENAETLPAPSCVVVPRSDRDPPAETPSCADGLGRYAPGGGGGMSFRAKNGSLPRMDIVSGGLRALLARPDLQAEPVSNGTFARIAANGTLSGGCRAFHVLGSAFGLGARPVTIGPIAVLAAAPGARLVRLHEDLHVIASTEDVLAFHLDDDRDLGETVQLCADAPVAYALHVERTRVEPAPGPRTVPAGGAAVVVLCLAALAWARRR